MLECLGASTYSCFGRAVCSWHVTHSLPASHIYHAQVRSSYLHTIHIYQLGANLSLWLTAKVYFIHTCMHTAAKRRSIDKANLFMPQKSNPYIHACTKLINYISFKKRWQGEFTLIILQTLELGAHFECRYKLP